jgi:hypothetical protein
MATAVSGVVMNGLSVETLRATLRYVLNVKVPGGTHHQSQRGRRMTSEEKEVELKKEKRNDE